MSAADDIKLMDKESFVEWANRRMGDLLYLITGGDAGVEYRWDDTHTLVIEDFEDDPNEIIQLLHEEGFITEESDIDDGAFTIHFTEAYYGPFDSVDDLSDRAFKQIQDGV